MVWHARLGQKAHALSRLVLNGGRLLVETVEVRFQFARSNTKHASVAPMIERQFPNAICVDRSPMPGLSDLPICGFRCNPQVQHETKVLTTLGIKSGCYRLANDRFFLGHWPLAASA